MTVRRRGSHTDAEERQLVAKTPAVLGVYVARVVPPFDLVIGVAGVVAGKASRRPGAALFHGDVVGAGVWATAPDAIAKHDATNSRSRQLIAPPLQPLIAGRLSFDTTTNHEERGPRRAQKHPSIDRHQATKPRNHKTGWNQVGFDRQPILQRCAAQPTSTGPPDGARRPLISSCGETVISRSGKWYSERTS